MGPVFFPLMRFQPDVIAVDGFTQRFLEKITSFSLNQSLIKTFRKETLIPELGRIHFLFIRAPIIRKAALNLFFYPSDSHGDEDGELEIDVSGGVRASDLYSRAVGI